MVRILPSRYGGGGGGSSPGAAEGGAVVGNSAMSARWTEHVHKETERDHRIVQACSGLLVFTFFLLHELVLLVAYPSTTRLVVSTSWVVIILLLIYHSNPRAYALKFLILACNVGSLFWAAHVVVALRNGACVGGERYSRQVTDSEEWELMISAPFCMFHNASVFPADCFALNLILNFWGVHVQAFSFRVHAVVIGAQLALFGAVAYLIVAHDAGRFTVEYWRVLWWYVYAMLLARY